MRTRGKILNDIAERSSSDMTTVEDIVFRHVTDSAQKLISKLRGRGRKRAHAAVVAGGKRKGRREERAPGKIIKLDISS